MVSSGIFYDDTVADQMRRVLERERAGLNQLIERHAEQATKASNAMDEAFQLKTAIAAQKELLDKLERALDG